MTARRGPRHRLGVGLLTAALLAWFLLPLLPLLLWAVADRWPGEHALPQALGLTGWQQLVEEGAVLALARSGLLGLVVALVATAGGALAGRVLAHSHGRLVRLGGAVLLAPLVVPPFAVALGLDVVLLRLRVPPAIGVVLLLCVVAIPYATYVMRSAYAAYDTRYEEQASSLGASRTTVLARVELPLVLPGLTLSALLCFLVGWSDYVVTLAVGGGQVVTYPLILAGAAAGSGNEQLVAALSVAAALPPLTAVLLLASADRRRVHQRDLA